MITLNTDAQNQIDNVIVGLKNIEAQSEVGSRVVRTVALAVLAEMKHRIQNEQKATNGSAIGRYSTKPIYVNVKNSPGSLGRPIGKPYNGKRRSKFANGRDHLTRYFAGGYKEYKSKIYPGLSGVNLTLTGTMMNQITVLPTENGWGIGWGDVQYSDRARYFEKKYRKRIFGASRQELILAKRTAERLIANAISKRTS